MKRSFKEHYETIAIEHFLSPANQQQIHETEIVSTILEIEVGTGTFAQAAMLKGFNEFYLKPAGQGLPEDHVKNIETNLAVLADLLKPTSGLILP